MRQTPRNESFHNRKVCRKSVAESGLQADEATDQRSRAFVRQAKDRLGHRLFIALATIEFQSIGLT